MMDGFKRLTPLDSLRGISAMGIAFFWHYQHFKAQNGAPFGNIGYWFFHFGWNLVDFFFVLSGFIFSYVYKERIISGKLSLYDYYILRISRLYPLHIITLFFVAFIQMLRYFALGNFFTYQYNDVYHFMLNLFFIQYGWFESGFSFNAPTWSVSCEIIAYLMFFAIIQKYRENKKHFIFYITIIFIGLFIIKVKLNIPLLNESMARVFIGFFIGCVLFELNKFLNKSNIRKFLLLICFLVLVLLSFSAAIFGNQIFGDWPIVYTILIYPLIIILSINVKFFSTLLSIKPLRLLGDLSYSLYLWHFPVQLLVKTIDDNFDLNINFSLRITFIGIILITMVVSYLSHFFLEKPLMVYIRRRTLKS